MVSYLLNQMRYAPHLPRLCLFYLILLMDVYGSCGSHCNKHKATRAIKLWVNLLSHIHSHSSHCIQWGLENHRLPHFHALPLTHKLHFIFLIYLAKMIWHFKAEGQPPQNKIFNGFYLQTWTENGTRLQNWEGEKKKINRKVYQSLRALGSMIIRGNGMLIWDKEKKRVDYVFFCTTAKLRK